MIEDAELLRRYAEDRSEAAFAELVHRRIGLVYSVALRQTRDAHRAEDVAQSVFSALARKAGPLSQRPVLVGWLYRSAQFAAADVVRAEQSRARREQEAHIMQTTQERDGPDPAWEKVRPVLDQVMGELPEHDRDAILLRFFDGRPFADIGTRLQLSENAARMRVERALDKLHGLLARRGITSTTAALGTILAQQATAATPAGLAATVTGTAMASAVAAPAVGLLQLMTTTQMATGAAGVALMILAIGTATYEYQSRRADEASLAAASRDQQAFASKLHGLEESVRVAEQDAAEMKQRLADARAADAAKAAAAAQAAKEKAAWDPAAEGKAFLKRHPEVRQALIEGQNASINFRYGRLYKPLGLTPAEIERFQALMRETKVASVSMGYGKMAALSTGMGMTEDEINSGLREFWGEERYKRYEEFGRDESARQITQEVAKALCFTDSPLTPEQADQLTQVISSSRVAKRGAPSFDWEAVTAKAQGVLLQPQLAAVDGLRAQAVWQATMYRPVKSPSK